PIRQLASLQADANGRRRMGTDRVPDGIRFRGTFAAPYDGTGLVNKADRSQIQRDIKPDIVTLFHDRSSDMLFPPPAEATGLSHLAPPAITPCPDLAAPELRCATKEMGGAEPPAATRSAPCRARARRGWRAPDLLCSE